MFRSLGKGTLFLAGMLTGATTGNLFYVERYHAGFAMFALTALFLFYAMSELVYIERDDAEHETEGVTALMKTMADLSLFVAEDAINGVKRIGRTMPCTSAEITSLEEVLMPLLSSLRLSHTERERISQELHKLKTRSRQNEGRRVLSGR